jgi:hypothetical protein
MKVILSQAYTQALAVIEVAVAQLANPAQSDYTNDVIAFEDGMNGLSGAILNLDPDLQAQIKNAVEVVAWSFEQAGYEVNLVSTLRLPPTIVNDSSYTVTRQAKNLYPLTTTITTVHEVQVEEKAPEVSIETDDSVIASLEDDLPESLDEIFAENEQETVQEESLASLSENSFIPLISEGMVTLAQEAAANANGLQAGLTTFSKNPIAHLTTSTKALLIYYTENNYANLNAALSIVSSDSNLTSQYKALREAIGGPDGLSGCVSQIDFFEDHTDRLSGLVLDTSSPNDQQDNDSTDEYIYVYDFSATSNTVIFSFDSRYFRSAKYMIQATAGALDRGHQATELYILHDNFHAYTREIAAMYTQDPFVTYTTRLLNGRVEVLAATTAANTDFVIHGQKLRIARQAKSYGEMSQSAIIEQHQLLEDYLNDGVDYVAKISGSLQKGYLVANLDREFRDMLIYMSSPVFTGLSTLTKQAGLLTMANTLLTRAEDLQTAIDQDYEEFVQARKNTEALGIAAKLQNGYTDDSSSATLANTLNSATINAIVES